MTLLLMTALTFAQADTGLWTETTYGPDLATVCDAASDDLHLSPADGAMDLPTQARILARVGDAYRTGGELTVLVHHGETQIAGTLQQSVQHTGSGTTTLLRWAPDAELPAQAELTVRILDGQRALSTTTFTTGTEPLLTAPSPLVPALHLSDLFLQWDHCLGTDDNVITGRFQLSAPARIEEGSALHLVPAFEASQQRTPVATLLPSAAAVGADLTTWTVDVADPVSGWAYEACYRPVLERADGTMVRGEIVCDWVDEAYDDDFRCGMPFGCSSTGTAPVAAFLAFAPLLWLRRRRS